MSQARICARELALWSPVVYRGPTVASRGIPWPPVDDGADNYVYIYVLLPKFQIQHCDQNFNVKVFRLVKHLL